MRNAVGYARTSSKLNPKASIPNQCKLINEYCEKNDIFLKEVYIDEAKTATKVEGRTGYMKLKSDLENGDIDIVIVSFFDRLAREAFEFVLTVVELNKKGVEIISISEDLSSKRMSPIHLAMIAFEIENENKQRTCICQLKIPPLVYSKFPHLNFPIRQGNYF
jgi:site-specific DNA recombinase